MRISVSFLAIGLSGCVPQADLGTTAGMSFEEYRAAASAHREPGTGAYIVDGDIVLHDDDQLYRYWASSQRGALTIHNVNGMDVKWGPTEQLNLSYCVSNGFGANKPLVLAAMTQATENGWVKFANIKFKYLASQDGVCNALNENVMFDIRPVDSNGQYLARAFFPDQPRSQRNVLVDADSFNTIWPLANILAHELGHALGFRHEHVRAPGAPCPEGTDYRGVTAYDPASVMHYPQCGGTSQDLSFTMLDRQGAAAVYGQPAPNLPPMVAINSPKDGDTVPPTFTVRTSILDMDVTRGVLDIDGVQYKVLVSPPFDFQVANLPEGPHTLVVKGTDTANQTVQQMIRITVKKPDEGGGGNNGGNMSPAEEEDTGCSTGGATSGAGVLVALGLAALRRRRRR